MDNLYQNQRIGIFVDAANMYHSAKNLYKANVNFGNILKTAAAKRQLIRATAYVIRSKSKEEKSFFEALDKAGFEVKKKDLQIFAGGEKKADWDVGIAMDAIKMADKLDVIVLVSGDGDYVPLVRYLQENKGCKVEIMAFKETTSNKLIEEANIFTNLSKNKKKFLIK